jgi:hypothetical protein
VYVYNFNMTTVCNCKVNFIRPKGYNNLKIWCTDPNNIYIGRKGVVFITNSFGNKERYPKEDSYFANPYKVGKDGNINEVLEMYYQYIKNKTDHYDKLLLLVGKNLGCWCVNSNSFNEMRCHGQVLLFIMNSYGMI